MKKAVITAIFGDYDTLKEPAVKTEGWEYICITDKYIYSDTWNIISIDTNDPQKEARKSKILPLIDRDLIIWCDGSMQINTNLDTFVKKHFKGDLTIMSHPDRDCTYQEAEACIKLKKDNERTITEQMDRYKREGYPEHNGMVGSGVFIRNNEEQTKQFLIKWWYEVCDGSIRDQLSFNYVLSKHPEVKISLMNFNITEKDFILGPHVRQDNRKS